MSKFRKISASVAALDVALLLTASNAYCTASFSRQTGLSCSTCHTTFPELTPFGREFKLNGYTLSGNDDIKEKSEKKTESGLSLAKYLPLSINVRASFTKMDQRQQGAQDFSAEVPQQVNLWFAGKIAEHAGSYVQMTYNVQANHFGFDNSDIRYARKTKVSGKDLTWGIDFNNNPTFEDLWHSTPGYGFPWVSPDTVVSPAAATLIDGTLAGDVIGLGGYAMWNDHLYGDVTLYHTQHIGGPQPATGVGFAHNIKGVAPYWRFAWQASRGRNYLEVGTYGIHAASFPGAISGPTDDFTDTAVDVTYERDLRKRDLLAVHSTFIYEKQNLGATFLAAGAATPEHNLKTFRLDAGYHFGSRYTITGGPFLTTGTADSLLYAPASVTGSANGKPKNSGYIAQLAWWAVQNVEIGLQYKGYVTFNGAGSNYDGSGRNASANNAAYVFIWLSL